MCKAEELRDRLGVREGEGYLYLVFTADLEQVEEVGGGGVDLDEVLVRLRLGVGEVADLEVLRTLFVAWALVLCGSVFDGSPTLTYS